MRNYIDKRILDEAYYILKHKATVRATAAEFGISKSTIHKDVTLRLYHLDKGLFNEVRVVLNENFSIKHIRGGEATKQKYKKNKKNCFQ